ncbi:uncharacterized protein LOC130986786 [Salvia miltiorrhiza]|uniref:uncharacterized protein LOC130986786 n=1 Tax=Salvia miltiorrhiza TaxID=226208 RepID=UPI0025ABA4E4|nr:uncharacterized protein LOC130986786 [Salvia miltiorrhiza]
MKMSSAQQESGSNDVCHARVNKTDKTRRSWTIKEEETLIHELKELVAQGWKSDNGFRAGYLNKLELAMKNVFPGTDLKGMPHINSKICAWKKNYYSLCLIFRVTGVGFNVHGDHMIDCTTEQWEQIVKKDSNARNMRKKSWPMLDAWKEVFGKDRATCDNAEDLLDAVTDMYQHRKMPQNTPEPDGDYHVNLDDVFEGEAVEESTAQSTKLEATTSGNKKKRKQSDESGNVFAYLGEISRNTGQRLDTLSSRVGYEFDVSKARKEVFEQVSLLPDLSLEQIFDVTELLAYKVERLDIFLGLPAEARFAYTMRLLQGKSK